jgi:hypothetical protein
LATFEKIPQAAREHIVGLMGVFELPAGLAGLANANAENALRGSGLAFVHNSDPVLGLKVMVKLYGADAAKWPHLDANAKPEQKAALALARFAYQAHAREYYRQSKVDRYGWVQGLIWINEVRHKPMLTQPVRVAVISCSD